MATPSDNPEVFQSKQVSLRVGVVLKPEPRYTERARMKQIVGTVVLRGVFSSSGTLTNITVLRKLPEGLTERAIDAAKKIRFIPAIKDGRFVSMWIQLEYNFNLY
ncbi:MAG TPA: energy transducer TonB [Pyrinomonadaceae bacterium]|nr:energy transducer TonB [Pyrinomonadaceae bacterium]